MLTSHNSDPEIYYDYTNIIMFRLIARRSLHYKTYPSIFSLDTKQTFLATSKNNELFQKLSNKIKNNQIKIVANPDEIDTDINSLTTLPSTQSIITVERKKINTTNQVPQWRKSPTLWFRIIREQMKIYRTSIKNVYKIHKHYKTIPAAAYSSQQLFRDLEFNVLNKGITRKQFVEMYRKNEFWKLPRFLLMFFIFEELFLVMVYLWPKLGLRSALTVGAYKKITNSHVFNNDLRNKMCGTVGIGKNIKPISSPYDLDINILKQLLVQLPTNEFANWKLNIWKLFKVKSKLANIVADRCEYYIVDDWLLLKKVMGNDTVSISKSELVNLIAERQLYNKGEDLNAMVNDSTGLQILIWRLALYWGFRFDKVDITSPTLRSNFTNKWGVNNVSILNFPGTLSNFGDEVQLFNTSHLNYINL